MSMDNTIIQQGVFVATAAAEIIQLRSDVDWMEVINFTTTTAAGADTGVKYYWQRGLADDAAFEYIKDAGTQALEFDTIVVDGFTRIDSSGNPDFPINANLTQINAAAPPQVLSGVTAPLVAGDAVRFVNVPGAQQFGGVDFTIDNINPNVSFDLPYGPTIVTTGAVVGSYYPIRYQPIYYPRRRFITSITQTSPAVVLLTVTHGYTVGQVIRFKVPAAYGMVEMNNLTGTILELEPGAVPNAVSVEIDATGFNAFAWPVTADVPFTPAQVVPLGEDSTLGITLNDATENEAFIAMRLGTGTHGPSGVATDVIFWRAGKSFSTE